ncbi:putative bifunctional diguanylate cyclase/phosphodiesterase [Phytohabitans kaempferiae]|uniref:Bifunctional diguanylate cyclase/phosphodiesterase n=1 Tax=Phytohabitans kaempferiae TaxID=1620943 RepID=A0ABV6M423_9ACTN
MSRGETGQLRLLTGLVLLSAGGCLAWAVPRLSVPSPSEAFVLVIAAALVVVGVGCSAPVRIRTQIRFNAASSAVLVVAVVLPPQWALVCVAAGVAVGRGVVRHRGGSLHKALHNGGTVVLAAAAATGAVSAAGVHPTLAGGAVAPWTTYLLALLVGAVAFVVVEEAVIATTVALVTGRSMQQVLRTDADIRLALNLACLAIAVAATALVMLDLRLLVAIPLAQLVLYLVYMHRLHLRAERSTWEQLAAATDALNGVDLTGVLHTAARGAVGLFNARQAQVELWDVEPCRLVRADADGVVYDGPSGAAPPPAPLTASRFLGGRDGSAVGVLRLALPATTVGLDGREESTLRAYGASLTTAILNARAYAELIAERDQHARDARRDPLTGLANRRALLDRLAEARESTGGTLALALVDLNRFKEVNDTLGHAFGDKLLVEVGERLGAAATDNGAVVARLGGDEFAILLEHLPAPATAIHRARRILDCLREPVALAGMQVTVQASAGIALAGPGVSAGELLRRADVAMYQAKRAGVAIVDYQHGRDTADHRQLSLGGELARAVAGGEFTVRFQPIVELGSGEAIAAEALTRWHHPRHGVLLPKQWLPIVERSDLLGAFTAGVLRQALAGLREWRAAGFDLAVALNVSPHSLLDPAFPAMVLEELGAQRLDPGSLVLELAETASVGQLQAVDRVLNSLRAAGVRLALDDFGTGHSSLSVVSEVPVHELKIDRTFVAAMRTSAQAAAAVRSTVELGRSLGLTVVAEGVETADQRQALWEVGCTAGQGHLFGRPVDAAELLDALRAGVDGVRGALAASLHRGATVIALRHRPPA